MKCSISSFFDQLSNIVKMEYEPTVDEIIEEQKSKTIPTLCKCSPFKSHVDYSKLLPCVIGDYFESRAHPLYPLELIKYRPHAEFYNKPIVLNVKKDRAVMRNSLQAIGKDLIVDNSVDDWFNRNQRSKTSFYTIIWTGIQLNTNNVFWLAKNYRLCSCSLFIAVPLGTSKEALASGGFDGWKFLVLLKSGQFFPVTPTLWTSVIRQSENSDNSDTHPLLGFKLPSLSDLDGSKNYYHSKDSNPNSKEKTLVHSLHKRKRGRPSKSNFGLSLIYTDPVGNGAKVELCMSLVLPPQSFIKDRTNPNAQQMDDQENYDDVSIEETNTVDETEKQADDDEVFEDISKKTTKNATKEAGPIKRLFKKQEEENKVKPKPTPMPAETAKKSAPAPVPGRKLVVSGKSAAPKPSAPAPAPVQEVKKSKPQEQKKRKVEEEEEEQEDQTLLPQDDEDNGEAEEAEEEGSVEENGQEGNESDTSDETTTDKAQPAEEEEQTEEPEAPQDEEQAQADEGESNSVNVDDLLSSISTKYEKPVSKKKSVQVTHDTEGTKKGAGKGKAKENGNGKPAAKKSKKNDGEAKPKANGKAGGSKKAAAPKAEGASTTPKRKGKAFLSSDVKAQTWLNTTLSVTDKAKELYESGEDFDPFEGCTSDERRRKLRSFIGWYQNLPPNHTAKLPNPYNFSNDPSDIASFNVDDYKEFCQVVYFAIAPEPNNGLDHHTKFGKKQTGLIKM